MRMLILLLSAIAITWMAAAEIRNANAIAPSGWVEDDSVVKILPDGTLIRR